MLQSLMHLTQLDIFLEEVPSQRINIDLNSFSILHLNIRDKKAKLWEFHTFPIKLKIQLQCDVFFGDMLALCLLYTSVQKCQNGLIEIWIRAAKFRKEIPIRSKDMDKIQTKFPRSGMHNLSYKHFMWCATGFNSWTINLGLYK